MTEDLVGVRLGAAVPVMSREPVGDGVTDEGRETDTVTLAVREEVASPRDAVRLTLVVFLVRVLRWESVIMDSLAEVDAVEDIVLVEDLVRSNLELLSVAVVDLVKLRSMALDDVEGVGVAVRDQCLSVSDRDRELVGVREVVDAIVCVDDSDNEDEFRYEVVGEFV